MLNEYGQDLAWTPEPSPSLTAVLPHPIHGRLVERAILMISNLLYYKGCVYKYSWKEGDVAYYRPACAKKDSRTC